MAGQIHKRIRVGVIIAILTFTTFLAMEFLSPPEVNDNNRSRLDDTIPGQPQLGAVEAHKTRRIQATDIGDTQQETTTLPRLKAPPQDPAIPPQANAVTALHASSVNTSSVNTTTNVASSTSTTVSTTTPTTTTTSLGLPARNSKDIIDPRSRVLSLVQKVLRVDCYELFKSKKINVSAPLTENFIQAARAHAFYINSKAMRLEGNSAKYNEQVAIYADIIKFPFIKTVCETGFNAGHDTLVWLASRPDTTVYSFDLGEHQYAHEMANYLQSIYPNRLSVMWGDSSKTIPEFHKNNPKIVCDLVVIDGGHSYEVALADFDNFKKMASNNNIVILDDYPSSGQYFNTRLGPVWEGKKSTGEVHEHFACEYKSYPHILHGFAIGSYTYAS